MESTTPNTKVKASHRLYKKYEYLADIYANKLFNTNSIGMDREDVVQELKLKIFTSIKGYGKRWLIFKKTGLYKPVPLPYYLQSSLNNKLKDLVDDINKDVMKHTVSVETNNFDYGLSLSDYTKIDFKNKELIVRGVDLLEGLIGKEKDAFSMILKGHGMPRIEKLFKESVPQIGKKMRKHLEKLRGMEDELLHNQPVVKYSYQLAEEEF